MKIYFAVTGKEEPRYLPKNNIKTLLCSYHYYKKDVDLIKHLIKSGCDIFIDSGAFSAENSDEKIDIDLYCKFLLETGAEFYAGLDVIGDHVATLRNQKYMEETYNLKPVPCFHMGEPIEALWHLLSSYSYIAIGGMVQSEGIENWLDKVWNEMYGINSKIKCHAFGLTSLTLAEKYPWTSIDSSSFKSGKRFGRFMLYNRHKNELINEDYNVWIHKYAELTTDYDIIDDTKYRYEITDVLSAKSYYKCIQEISKKHNEKNFSYLTSQQKLF